MLSIDETVLLQLATRQPQRFKELNKAIPVGFRKLDRAIQRLHKGGKIKYDRKQGWTLDNRQTEAYSG